MLFVGKLENKIKEDNIWLDMIQNGYYFIGMDFVNIMIMMKDLMECFN